MNVSRILAIAALSTACGGAIAQGGAPVVEPVAAQTASGAAAAPVNPKAAVLADFNKRVEQYADLHKQLAKGNAEQKETADPAKLNAAQTALAARIQSARANAKHGDIFTPEVRPVFRRLLAPELKGEDGRDAKAILKDDAPAPGTVPFKVNAKYPDSQPKPTVPANLLQALPPLPMPLEYRIVGQHLLLMDTSADLVVDYILNAITK